MCQRVHARLNLEFRVFENHCEIIARMSLDGDNTKHNGRQTYLPLCEAQTNSNQVTKRNPRRHPEKPTSPMIRPLPVSQVLNLLTKSEIRSAKTIQFQVKNNPISKLSLTSGKKHLTKPSSPPNWKSHQEVYESAKGEKIYLRDVITRIVRWIGVFKDPGNQLASPDPTKAASCVWGFVQFFVKVRMIAGRNWEMAP